MFHETLLSAPYPRAISLESTNLCNLRCSHCGHSQFPPFSRGHLEMGLLRKVEGLLGSEIKELSLSNFGEPFISRQWKKLLAWALSIEDLNLSFITNGLLLERHIEEIMDRRISFAVSVDGVSEDIYGYFRGRNNLTGLLRNLRLFSEMKEKNRGNCPRLTLLVTVSKINVHELREMVRLARACGAETVIVQFQLFFGRERFEKESLFFSQDEYNRYIAMASREAARTGITLVHPDSFDGETAVDRGKIDNPWLGRNGQGGIRCFAFSSVCYVKHDGVVEACCSPDHNIMGDLLKDSFDAIWYGPGYRALRLAFDRGQWPERCGCCNLIQAVDVHDRRAHLVEIPEKRLPSAAGPLKYDITGVERIYKEALSKVREDPEEALRLLSGVSGLDDNLYEVASLIACIRGAKGETETMVRHLKRCAVIAPRDPYVLTNYAHARDLRL